VSRSLVVEGDGRFDLLETIREFALDRLVEAGREQATRRRHAGYFGALAAEARPQLRGPQDGEWLERLEREHENLRAALGWSFEHETAWAFELVDSLYRFWYTRGHFREGLGWYERARELVDADPARRAELLKLAAAFAYGCRDLELASEFAEESLAIYRDLEDIGETSRILVLLGLLAGHREEHPRAVTLLEESVRLARETGEPATIAFAVSHLSSVALGAGDSVRALPRPSTDRSTSGGACCPLSGSRASSRGTSAPRRRG
jgi:tetratricopeptide (TPR) repeat protein